MDSFPLCYITIFGLVSFDYRLKGWEERLDISASLKTSFVVEVVIFLTARTFYCLKHITARTSHTHFTVRFTFYCEIDAVGDYQCPSEMSVEDVPAVVKHQDTEKALYCTQVRWLIAHKFATGSRAW